MKISDIKKSAKLKLSGNYFRCASSSLLYFIIISLITFFQTKLAGLTNNSIVLAFLQAISLILSWILGYGIIENIIDLTEVKTNSITDFINSTLKNTIKYTKLGFLFLIRILAPLTLFLFAIFYWIGNNIAKIHKVNFLCFNQNLVTLSLCIVLVALILLIYFILKYVLIAYIYHNNKELSEKEILDKSKELMKKNKFNYILLLLSFFHLFLFGALILFVLNFFIEAKYLTPFMVFFYSMIKPYLIVAKSEFYKELNEEKE